MSLHLCKLHSCYKCFHSAYPEHRIKVFSFYKMKSECQDSQAVLTLDQFQKQRDNNYHHPHNNWRF